MVAVEVMVDLINVRNYGGEMLPEEEDPEDEEPEDEDEEEAETARAETQTVSKLPGNTDTGKVNEGLAQVNTAARAKVEEHFEIDFKPVREWLCSGSSDCGATTKNYFVDGWSCYNEWHRGDPGLFNALVAAGVIQHHIMSTTLVCPKCAPGVEWRFKSWEVQDRKK